MATGVGGVGGNKGAVAVRMAVGSTELAFVAAHLAAHQVSTPSHAPSTQVPRTHVHPAHPLRTLACTQGHAEERNRHYKEIRDRLLFPASGPSRAHRAGMWGAGASADDGSTRRLFGATDGPSHFGEQQLLEHDVVVFFGDLNYASTASPARSWRHVAHSQASARPWWPLALGRPAAGGGPAARRAAAEPGLWATR